MVALFILLLVIAILTPVAAVVRGPNNPAMLSWAPRDVFAAARVDVFQFVWAWIAVGAVVSIVLSGAATLLFRQRQRNAAATILSFSFLCLAIGIHGLLLGMPGVTRWGLTLNFTPVGWSLFTIGLMIFPDGRFRPPAMRWVALALALVTPLSAVENLPVPFGPVGIAFLMLAVAALVLRYRRLPPGMERQQIRWALSGFAAGALLTIPAVTLGILASREGVSPNVRVWSAAVQFLVLGPLLRLFIAGGLLVSLLKYRLYAADRVISRSVSYGALTLVLLALFAGTENVIQLLGEEYFGQRLGVLAGGIGAAFAAVMIVPLHHWLSDWAAHRFQKELVRLREGLPLLVNDMRETASVARIAGAVLDSVSQGVQTSRAALVMNDTLVDARGISPGEVESWRVGWTPAPYGGPECALGDTTFPIRVPLQADGSGRVGWLLVGPRPDGSLYGKDERKTLAQIADPVARALDIARIRETRQSAEDAKWKQQAELNTNLVHLSQELLRKLESLDLSSQRPLGTEASKAAE